MPAVALAAGVNSKYVASFIAHTACSKPCAPGVTVYYFARARTFKRRCNFHCLPFRCLYVAAIVSYLRILRYMPCAHWLLRSCQWPYLHCQPPRRLMFIIAYCSALTTPSIERTAIKLLSNSMVAVGWLACSAAMFAARSALTQKSPSLLTTTCVSLLSSLIMYTPSVCS